MPDPAAAPRGGPGPQGTAQVAAPERRTHPLRTPVTLAQLRQIAAAAARGWVDDNAPSMGAALAYYTLFSLAPERTLHMSSFTKLIAPGVLGPMTRMVLVNAIYFYGGWEQEFKKERTKDAPFFPADGSKMTAPLMSANCESLRYAERDGVQIAELPYKGGRLAMVVVLPKAGGLAAAEQLVAKEGLG